MGAIAKNWAVAWLLILTAMVGVAPAAAGQEVSILTNAGDVLQGALSGLAPILRLADPTPKVGPAMQFDVPIPSIQQLWVDFPRIVIETAERVLVAPYSAFTGIAELLRVEAGSDLVQIPFTAIRQIAFDGNAFRPLPREWLGWQWLNQRVYVKEKTATAAAASSGAAAVAVAPVVAPIVPVVSDADDEIVWNGALPTEPAPTAPSGELPGWVLLVGLAVLLGLFFLLPQGSGS